MSSWPYARASNQRFEYTYKQVDRLGQSLHAHAHADACTSQDIAYLVYTIRGIKEPSYNPDILALERPFSEVRSRNTG